MIELLEFTCGRCQSVNRLKVERVLQMTQSPRCGGCRENLLSLLEKPLEELDPAAYTHPLDKEALAALEKVPGVRTYLRELIKNTDELRARLTFKANFLQVNERQVPSLYAKFRLAAERLGVTTLPDLYIFQSEAPNAFTSGVDSYQVAISTGALDLLTDEEQLSVLAHELSHVHANHVLYKTAARVIAEAAGTAASATLGLGALVVLPLRMALSRWDRASELTADRGSLLVVRRPEVVLSALMKVAGGCRSIMPELSIKEFIAQAESFEKMRDENAWAKMNVVFQTLFRSHPFPVYRAREVIDFVTSGEFLEILDGDYPRRKKVPMAPCPACGKDRPQDVIVCPHCGHGAESDGPGVAGGSASASASAGGGGAQAGASARAEDVQGERVDGAGGDEGLGDKMDRGFEEARAWFKRTFNRDEPPPPDKTA